MSYTSAQFLARYPEFSAIIVPTGVTVAETIQVILDENDADTSDEFGDNRGRAVFLQTAHALGLRHKVNLAPYGIKDLTNPGLSSGKQVAGHSISEQFVLPTNMLQWRGDWRGYYSRTTYGLEYLALCERSIGNGVASF